jgi:hypothetical protein
MEEGVMNRTPLALAAAAALSVASPPGVRAHCDTVDGPVVQDARRALEAKDVTPALKWVRPKAEGEIREAFRQALAVRGLGAEARALADRSFLETLVRIHREGEGAPYSGLKPAGSEVDPAILASDQALETGSVDALVKTITADNGSVSRARAAPRLTRDTTSRRAGPTSRPTSSSCTTASG